jgi:hypothetical protein
VACQVTYGFLGIRSAAGPRTGKPVPSRPGLRPSRPAACTRPRHGGSQWPCHAVCHGVRPFEGMAASHPPRSQWPSHHDHMPPSCMEWHVDHHHHPSMGGDPIALGVCDGHGCFQTPIQPPNFSSVTCSFNTQRGFLPQWGVLRSHQGWSDWYRGWSDWFRGDRGEGVR